MSTKSDKVKSGYAELDSTEKAEVKTFIEKFEKATYTEQKTFSDQLRGILNKSLGPTTSSYSCPCCGK